MDVRKDIHNSENSSRRKPKVIVYLDLIQMHLLIQPTTCIPRLIHTFKTTLKENCVVEFKLLHYGVCDLKRSMTRKLEIKNGVKDTLYQ